MKTFFRILVQGLDGIDRTTDIVLGPYVSLLEAQTILLEFLPMINDTYEHEGYLATITEELYTEEGWITIEEVLKEEYEHTR